MAGLLAWAADVVGGHGSVHGDEADDIPILFTEEQQNYVRELDRKSASLTRAIQDLRQRLPPADISQRLPHLLAHSLASNAALTMQLNAHSATKEQTQLREVTLQEENAAYERAISNCESKIQEKLQEADLLQRKLKEIDDAENILREQMENAEAAKLSESAKSSDLVVLRKEVREGSDTEAAKVSVLEKLEAKKKELSSMEEIVQELERKWAHTQEKALKQPTPAQREKILDKQLHSLIEQLAAKQSQAEALVSEIHLKEMELERLSGLWKQIESNSNGESNYTARNRYGRSNSFKISAGSLDYMSDKLPHSTGGRTEYQQRLVLLRSAFVLYILFLHIVVFIKLSF
ncbi:unnamed protein product [Linum trigynum]|uniref:Uncharacterized protein n=1 Tax=Linum trigynum TaxID=586398 RepID=A0AAV2EYS2_9ROSI